jgi:ATP-binding cassette subfamily B protein
MTKINIPLRKYWDILAEHLKSRAGKFILLALAQMAAILLTLFIPQVTRRFIDSAQAGAAESVLLTIAGAFLLISVAQQIISVFARYIGEVVAWGATNELRYELAEHCLQMDMSFHNATNPGELIERIDGDVQSFGNFFSQLVVKVIGNILLLIGILVILSLEDIRVGIIFALFSSLTIFLLNRIKNIAIPHQKKRREVVTELFGFIEERLAGVEDIKANNGLAYVINGLYKLHDSLYTAWQKAEIMHVMVRLTAGLTLMTGYAIAMYWGARLYGAGTITLGTVYLIIQYTNVIARPIRELTRQVQNLQNIGANVDRIDELKKTESVLKNEGTEVIEGTMGVDFKRVDFSYNGEDQVLMDLSFSLKEGNVLGILGRTGSGKTTIARLICRLYEPQKGEICYNGLDFHLLELSRLQSRIAYVTQDVQLFQASVRDNLTFFKNDISDEKLLNLISEMGLSSWYENLPKGLDTVLQSGGKGLSAGEGQLLAFLRAFLRDPALVILDEASSRLDPATEVLIEKAVTRLLEGRTGIIIAHRLKTLDRVDDILILDDGRAVESGERRVLLEKKDSLFNRLLKKGLEEVMV